MKNCIYWPYTAIGYLLSHLRMNIDDCRRMMKIECSNEYDMCALDSGYGTGAGRTADTIRAIGTTDNKMHRS